MHHIKILKYFVGVFSQVLCAHNFVKKCNNYVTTGIKTYFRHCKWLSMKSLKMYNYFLPSLFFFLSTVGLFHFSENDTVQIPAYANVAQLKTEVETIYETIAKTTSDLPKIESFSQALAGFYDLKASGKISKDIITIIDFSLSSTTKRLWVIDLTTNTVLLHSLVSHGINSGLEYANSFSNRENSFKSSLGLYVTGESYMGKHGLSLRLDGMEHGLNDKARDRGVVVHGAKYANPNILNSQHYLGRSQGCPAIPEKLSTKLINIIKDKSCLYIYHPSRSNVFSVALSS